MIPIIVTPTQLYDLMMRENFDVLCSYLHNQSVIGLYAPSPIYSTLKNIYAYYGSRGVFTHNPKPRYKNKQLVEKLMSIITLVPVAPNNDKYQKYGVLATYVELYVRMQAFGIWNERIFLGKPVKRKSKIHKIVKEGIPFLPTSEILRFIGKEMDYLVHRLG